MFVILNCFIYSNYIFYLGVFSICSSSGPRALGICLFLLTLGLETCLMFWIYVFFVSLCLLSWILMNSKRSGLRVIFSREIFILFVADRLYQLYQLRNQTLFECFPNWVSWLNLNTIPEVRPTVTKIWRGEGGWYINCQLSSVAQSCLTLCDPIDCSMPGFLVHHQLQELTQTHVHWVGDAIQPSHPLSSPSPPAFNLS